MTTINSVKEGESPAIVYEDGDNTYVCYPDYNVQDETVAKWAISRINTTSGTKIQWAEGVKDKRFKVSERTSLTYKNLV
jgi:hypothetical protein